MITTVMSLQPKPPHVKQIPYTHRWQEHTWEDPYHWLRDRKDPAVLEQLQAENQYADEVLADTATLQEEIWQEIRSRVRETDTSAPVTVDQYQYYTRTEEGKDYAIYCRRESREGSREEILLDQNVLAQEHAFFELGVCVVSPDHQTLVYSVDTVGNEEFVIQQKNLISGAVTNLHIPNTGPSLEWDEKSAGFYYTVRDETLRPYQVRYHQCGSDIAADTVVWEDPDRRFYVTVAKTKDRQYVLITAASKETSEVWYLDAQDASTVPSCVLPRAVGHEYYIEHHQGWWYILTNHQAPNFRLCRTQVAEASHKEMWEEYVAHRSDVMLESIEVFAGYCCVFAMREGVTDVDIYDLATDESYIVPWEESAYYVQSLDAPDFARGILRVFYSSLVTPGIVYDIDLREPTPVVVKRTEVPGYEPAQYVTERLQVTASDGETVPVSIVRHKTTILDGTAPGLVEGYGAYGVVEPVLFRNSVVSLLDRGFVFAIAHVRGGGEKGRRWYEAGKYRKKHQTFSDFIAVAEYLQVEKYVHPERLVAQGASAGGYLIGAVLNQRPDLFAAAIAEVPFVDVLNTMCDASLPLTIMEYEEWGDPHDAEYFQYIQAHAPYEQVTTQAYPRILAWAGLHDTRVPYWEAAKWVARLRDVSTGDAEILLKTDLAQGHGGASGRYQQWRETAYRLAFAISTVTR